MGTEFQSAQHMTQDERLAQVRLLIAMLDKGDNTRDTVDSLSDAFSRLDYALTHQGTLPYDWRYAVGAR